jgi:hypothetical protein
MSKKGNEYLKITYSVGTNNFNEFMFFKDPAHFQKRNMETWWTFRGGLLPMPADNDEALERASNELAVPSLIRVDLAKDHPQVVGCDFDTDERSVPPCPDDLDIPF